jgi:hypothetical protein
MRGWPGRRRVAAGLSSESQRARDGHAGDYEGAMAGVRHALADLDAARADRSNPVRPAILRGAHERIDDGLARAAAAATAVYNALFEAAGGMYHAESEPEVALWKRQMNTALTHRSQHQLSQLDDEGAVAGLRRGGAQVRNRAAFGPHQAGLDFDVHLDAHA